MYTHTYDNTRWYRKLHRAQAITYLPYHNSSYDKRYKQESKAPAWKTSKSKHGSFKCGTGMSLFLQSLCHPHI